MEGDFRNIKTRLISHGKAHILNVIQFSTIKNSIRFVVRLPSARMACIQQS